MSRLSTRSTRARQTNLSPAPTFHKAKEQVKIDHRQTNAKKHKVVQRRATTVRRNGLRKKGPRVTPEEDSSSAADSESADEASDEESDDSAEDDDQEGVMAPPRFRSMNGAGRQLRAVQADNHSLAGTESMFGDHGDDDDADEDPNLSPEENRKLFERKVFADSEDDDDPYHAVDDISDSDDDLDEKQMDDQELLAMLSEEDRSDTDFLLNQIDGLSAYGFGDDSDAGSIHRLASSQESDNGHDISPERHVHFAADGDRSAFLRMSQSPTITRALLPSAMPDSFFPHHPAVMASGMADDLEDSDLTDDCLPEEAVQANGVVVKKEKSPSVSPPTKKSKKFPRRRGPPRGIFIDEGTKTSGILDPSGKIILMTNPHLLGEEFARRYGASQTSSPDLGFAELIDESDMGDQDAPGFTAATDIMLAGLNSTVTDPANPGQAVGPLEAFYPSIMVGDYAIDPDELDDSFRPDDDMGEDVIRLADVIKFDEDSDDSDGPTSPIFMPPSLQVSGLGNVNNEFAYLNNNNVTAFRRNADPQFAALSNTPSFRDLDYFHSSATTPSNRRKRKTHASPYTSSHYKGVTPVQRMRDPNHPPTPDDTTPVKRRRIMT